MKNTDQTIAEALRFGVPAVNQGQIVEVAYAAWGDEVIRRIHDRSEGPDAVMTYSRAAVMVRDYSWYETWTPNEEPAIPAGRWRSIDTRTLAKRLEADY